MLGEDCANAEVAMATAAVVAKNKRLFIENLRNGDADQTLDAARGSDRDILAKRGSSHAFGSRVMLQ